MKYRLYIASSIFFALVGIYIFITEYNTQKSGQFFILGMTIAIDLLIALLLFIQQRKEKQIVDKEGNIVKKVCKELNITQKELAQKLGVPQSTVSGWANGDIPKMTKYALELMIENHNLKTKLSVFKEAYKIASEL